LEAELIDRSAENWLHAQHGKDWYIGNASSDEWKAAYEAVDRSRVKLDAAEAECERLRQKSENRNTLYMEQRARAITAEAERDRYLAVVKLVGEAGMFACQQPLPRIAEEDAQ
jgi:hypothetical protein